MRHTGRFQGLLLPCSLIAVLAISGCSRRDYRQRADADAYRLLREKSAGTPWQLPDDYQIDPLPQSRLSDPSDPDFPQLPQPGPFLVTGRRPLRGGADGERLPAPDPVAPLPMPGLVPPEPLGEPSVDEGAEMGIRFATDAPLVARGVMSIPTRREAPSTSLRSLPPVGSDHIDSTIVPAAWQSDSLQEPSEASGAPEVLPRSDLQSLQTPPSADIQAASTGTINRRDSLAVGLPVQAVPPDYWGEVPPACLQRMLQFDSVRQEYERSRSSGGALLPPSAIVPGLASGDVGVQQGLTLSKIVELAKLNSRRYQSQKEQLYVAALDVSLQRYDYDLKFAPSGNGTSVSYSHSRTNGDTVNQLSIPTAFQLERMLATGGNLVARFANDVVLTFNGPNGFASDIGSELLFDLTQSVLQRDVLLERLIASERSVVYAARDFARFRKQFFFDLASQYYAILQAYRAIEIDSQNYFSLVRTFEQAQAEVRAAVENAPNQVAVDQFEQSMLSGRSRLITRCNQLERALDELKLIMGLPTEQPLQVNLNELDQLTLLDRLSVAAERASRWRSRVRRERERATVDRSELLNASVFLIDRLLDWFQLRGELAGNETAPRKLVSQYWRYRVEQARDEQTRAEIARDRAENPASPQPLILRYRRVADLIDAHMAVAERLIDQLEADQLLSSQQRQSRLRQLETLRGERARFQAALANSLRMGTGDDLADRFRQLRQLEVRAKELQSQLLAMRREKETSPSLEQLVRETDELLAATDRWLGEGSHGLPELGIDVDSAMLTALVQRLDLMNERGMLADDWRNVKYAADELKSVLNLGASHRLRTDRNRPFGFDFDDSQTQLRVNFDLPLNRRSQRNAYRRSLLNYHAGRRNLMELEDTIKAAVRDGLRRLEETRVQYPISVTQAALADEQVISIRLQLALGVQGVRGTDLLDALQGSREALTSVANSRIGYLVDRTRFVLDLELIQLDETGFWPPVDDPDYRPRPNPVYPSGAGPTYGRLPSRVKPSRLLQRIYGHPLPGQ